MSGRFREAVQEKAVQLGVKVEDSVVDLFVRHYELLVSWNEKMNLTRVTDPVEAAEKHFADSLALYLVPGLNIDGKKVVDVGSGAGFPGMVLAAASARARVTLLDSLGKRVKFLEAVQAELGLANVNVIHMRAEDYGQGHGRESFELVVARAVARLSVLAEYCLPLCSLAGRFVAMKGPEAERELAGAEKAIGVLGGRLERVQELMLPGGERRSLIVIEKVRGTPSRYPRRPGKPERSPL